MNAVARKKGLGRGLEALLGGSADITEAVKIDGAPNVLPLGKLQAGKYQPRTRMDEGALQELAASIRTQGVMQPILVRPVSADMYEIIAGERRFRAARLAGLDEVPVLVKDNIDTADKMMTTAGSLALVGAKPARDAGVVAKLRAAGAVLLGKTNLSEWANIRSTRSSSGWSARGGLTANPFSPVLLLSSSSSEQAAFRNTDAASRMLALRRNTCMTILRGEDRDGTDCRPQARPVIRRERSSDAAKRRMYAIHASDRVVRVCAVRRYSAW